MTSTVGSAIDRSLEALEALARLGETIEDEWQYVADLRTVWGGRLVAVRDARADDPIQADVEAAIHTAVAEAGRITDPHRAIDWLSTFPQVALLALGEPS
jgi:hypothetical protein